MPMPVSSTSKRASAVRVLLDDPGAQCDEADLGELDRIVGVVEQGLLQPGGVADKVARHPVHHANQAQPLAWARSSSIDTIRDDRLDAQRDLLEHKLAGVDLGEVEDRVDDRQQVPGGGLELLHPQLLRASPRAGSGETCRRWR
jgi:hypothetical protein